MYKNKEIKSKGEEKGEKEMGYFVMCESERKNEQKEKVLIVEECRKKTRMRNKRRKNYRYKVKRKIKHQSMR